MSFLLRKVFERLRPDSARFPPKNKEQSESAIAVCVVLFGALVCDLDGLLLDLSLLYLSEMRCSVHSFVIVLIEVAVSVSDEGAPPLPVESELVLSEGDVFPVTSTCCPR